MQRFRAAAFLLPFILMSPSILIGQSSFNVGLIGGVSQYDLSGTGTTGFGGIRVDIVPSTEFLVLEVGLHYFSYHAPLASRQTLWFPEASIQIQMPGRIVRPYIGAGAGYAFGSGESVPTLAASLGSRFRLSYQWLLRGELRVRSVDPWIGTTADWGLGISRTL